MAESETTSPTTKTPKTEEDAAERNPGPISLRIWPPSQKTRGAVVSRLVETLSTESIFSKKFETLRREEALPVAKSIEEEAYDGVTASAAVYFGGDDGDGIEILKAYSKRISKLVLDSLKSRPVANSDGVKEEEEEEEEEANVDSVKLET